ncbi:hypothetical protein HAV15_012138 [Penicillium sp. str. |nr:hypothetical protein HAV15_012138 [Penicillium sp. str. \
MYAQGDYFQINSLKTKAKQNFEESLMNSPSRESFASAVIEVYNSTGENDRGLRDFVVRLTTDNLTLLRTMENPILDSTLLEIPPAFMLEICLSVLEKCAEYQRLNERWDYHSAS